MEHAFNELLSEYESGRMSRRELLARMSILTAAIAGVAGGSPAAAQEAAPFKVTALNHIALSVTDVARSRDFYRDMMGMTVTRDNPGSAFLSFDKGFLALFGADAPAMHHYCYSIENYDVDEVEAKLKELDLNPRRQGGRIYFDDPDGLEVQFAAEDHSA